MKLKKGGVGLKKVYMVLQVWKDFLVFFGSLLKQLNAREYLIWFKKKYQEKKKGDVAGRYNIKTSNLRKEVWVEED